MVHGRRSDSTLIDHPPQPRWGADVMSADYDPTMVQRFTDYRLYISEALKAIGYTRGALADHLGISRAMVSHVLNTSRKMNPTLVKPLGDFFHLDALGRNLLGAMVDLDNESVRARRSAWATLQAHQRYLAAGRPDQETLRVLSTWWICAIFELASTPAFQPDPRWIARVMNPRITEEMAQEGLQTLLASGLLVSDGEGGLVQEKELHWTDSSIVDSEAADAVWRLQQSMLRLASETFGRHPAEQTHRSASVFAIPASRVEGVITRLRELEREVFHLATSPAQDRPERVHVLSVNFFPLTDDVTGS
jgi:uncharacterized protein (TIGR02147 family)